MGISRRAALWCCSVMALVTGLATDAHAADVYRPPSLTLNLVLSQHRLASLSASVMKRELARIWGNEGVAIVWRETEQQVPVGEAFVRLTLIDDVDRPHRAQQKYVLGDFLPEEGRIRISLFAATQAATKSTITARRSREAFDRPRALGFILGRALAHEVGHALLGRAHAESGLMSATFDPATMADAMSDDFGLTTTQTTQLSLTRVTLRTGIDDGGVPVALDVEGDSQTLAR